MRVPATQFLDALLSVDRVRARQVLSDLESHITPLEQIDGIIVPSLDRLGLMWEKGTAALSQVYMAGRICEELVEEMLPPMSPDRKSRPRMAVSVLHDHHGLGKRIVYSLVRAGGYEILDYGRRTVDELIEMIERDHIEILLVSVLMLPSALKIRELKQRLARNLSSQTLIVVGGAPFRLDPDLAAEVGADAVGRDASDIMEIARKLAD